MALQLVEVAIAAGGGADAHRLRADLLERLGARATNGVERNIYREAAVLERKAEPQRQPQ